jgi:S1-C subfamily serine protease
VFTVGFPATTILGTAPKFSDGAVSALTGPHDESTQVQVTVPVQGGNSGGALLNQRGEVVGVITTTAAQRAFVAATGRPPQNVNWAVKSEYALLLLDELPAPSAAATREGAIDRALGATCLVEATR